MDLMKNKRSKFRGKYNSLAPCGRGLEIQKINFPSPTTSIEWERVPGGRVREGRGGKKAAFTLAEVLITLGVIGVVAALTIPSLVTNYQKRQVEIKLKKFYSTINQVVRASMVDNDSPEGWLSDSVGKNYSYNEEVKFLQTYMLPYMKYNGYKRCYTTVSDGVCVYLFDGGIMWFTIDINGCDIAYLLDNDWENRDNKKQRKYFVFQFNKIAGAGNKNLNSVNFVEPYTMSWNGTREQLLDGIGNSCKQQGAFCTKLIQTNSWKIPKDYPW
ncbi:type II secretion system protein [bacterium]|nr:type II secretion system protein [bacterium]